MIKFNIEQIESSRVGRVAVKSKSSKEEADYETGRIK